MEFQRLANLSLMIPGKSLFAGGLQSQRNRFRDNARWHDGYCLRKRQDVNTILSIGTAYSIHSKGKYNERKNRVFRETNLKNHFKFSK